MGLTTWNAAAILAASANLWLAAPFHAIAIARSNALLGLQLAAR